MRIAIVVPSLRNLGPLIVVKDLVSSLKMHNIDIFYFDDYENVLSFDVKCRRISFFKFFDFSEYDVVHSHGIRPDIYTALNPTCKKTISTQHNIIFEEYRINKSYVAAKIIEKIWKLSLLNKTKIVAIGHPALLYYQNLLPNNFVVNIPNGRNVCSGEMEIDKEEELLINNFKFGFTCIGTCTHAIKRKGHAQIIEALVDLPNFCFILIGDGDYLENLKKLSKLLNVSDRCLFLGYKDNAISYIKYFDIYSQTTYAESVSIALLEAAALKKSIVCSNIPANNTLFNLNEVSFFELNNINSLKVALERAKERKETYENNVFNKYLSEYTVDIMANRYLELYESFKNEI